MTNAIRFKHTHMVIVLVVVVVVVVGGCAGEGHAGDDDEGGGCLDHGSRLHLCLPLLRGEGGHTYHQNHDVRVLVLKNPHRITSSRG
jgi:hypothetical protein